jgi:FMN hydrolase / 5-amino-6-(5-phospho-D-ribitylamino)uracil phosphatase
VFVLKLIVSEVTTLSPSLKPRPAQYPRLSNLKAVTLDLDDTLWPVEPSLVRAELALREFFAGTAPLAAARFADADAIHGLRRQLASTTPALLIDMGAFRRALIHAVLQQTGEDTGLVESAFDVFYTQRNKVDHYPDTIDALTRLSRRYKLLALSNGNADLNRVGIGHYFAGAIAAGDIGIAKPDPRIFQSALTQLQLHAHEVVHVGDDPHLDVDGAMNAGLDAVWVNRNDKPWPLVQGPTHQVADLDELCLWLGC